MMIRSAHRRSGFTLLEVLAASAIGLIVLATLYFSFDVVLRQVENGREVTKKSDLVRAIVHRMTQDIPQSLSPLPPKSGGGIPASIASHVSTPTTPAAEAPEAADPAAAVADPNATPASEANNGADVPFQGGVFGSSQQLTMYVSRIPRDITNRNAAALTLNGGTPTADLRRVTYYLGATGGLCRQEQLLVTTDGVRNSTNPDRTLESQDMIASEVSDVTFEYFDGTAWTSSWTGDDTTEDGKNVVGPPRAIRMTLVIQEPTGETKSFQHVFTVRAAVGTYVPPMEEMPATDPAAAGSM
jgi:prepilin-type N-terminal cleavage/methylation domain-containing protein